MSEITNLKVSNVLYDIKEKREVGHNLVTSLSNLDGSKNRVIANLSGPSALSINSSKPMNVGSTMYIACKPSMSFQQSLQGTGLHCVKDNINAKKDTPFTIKITCFAPNQYFVVVYDEMYTWVDVVITGVNGAEMVNLEVDDASDGTHSNVHSFTNVKEDINITTKSIDGGFIFRAKKPGFKEFYKTGHFKFGEVNTINVVFEELPKLKDPRTVVPGDVLLKNGGWKSASDITTKEEANNVLGIAMSGSIGGQTYMNGADTEILVLAFGTPGMTLDGFAAPFSPASSIKNYNTSGHTTLGVVERYWISQGEKTFFHYGLSAVIHHRVDGKFNAETGSDVIVYYQTLGINTALITTSFSDNVNILPALPTSKYFAEILKNFTDTFIAHDKICGLCNVPKLSDLPYDTAQPLRFYTNELGEIGPSGPIATTSIGAFDLRNPGVSYYPVYIQGSRFNALKLLFYLFTYNSK